MKTVFKLALVAAMSLGFSACGVGVEDDDAATAQQNKDSQKLGGIFAPAIGQYEGSFTSTDSDVAPLRGKLSIYTLRLPEGTNPDGSARIRLVLFGRFQLLDVVTETDYTSMTGDYDKFGNLTLAASSAAAGGGTGGTGSGSNPVATAQIAVAGSILSGNADIDLFTYGRSWGKFVGVRTSTQAQAPAAGDEQEYARRLRSLYKTIEGRYQGTIDNGAARAKVEILITIGETAVGGAGVSYPYLLGQYRRLDFPDGIGERQLSINYNSVSGYVSMSNRSSDGTVPGSQTFSGNGSWKRGVLTVDLSDRRGPLGTLVSTRKPLRD